MKSFMLFLTVSVLGAWAQAPNPKLTCDQTRFFVDGLVPYCEIREMPVPYGGSLAISGINGGISVYAWDGQDILVRVQVLTAAQSESGAQALAGLVTVDSSTSGKLIGGGPTNNLKQTWSESFEVYVPSSAALSLTTVNGSISVSGVQGPIQINTVNGSISVSDVQGPIQFTVVNGTVTLTGVGGDVQGHDVNGNVFVGVGGDHWQGQTLDVATVNGNLELDVPFDCSAHVQLSTTKGSITTNFAVPSWGTPGFGMGRTLSFDVGAGGPLVRATTVHGNIQLKRLDPPAAPQP